jgi:signal peptidase
MTMTEQHGSERTTTRRVATVLGTLVLVAAIVPFAVFAVPQVIGADHGFVILSGSMEPTVSPGDVVIVDRSASVGVGDVITFSDGGEVPTTHRVIGVQDGQYVTQGDANQYPDSNPVAPSNVLGRVVLTIPLIGHVILWVNTPLGYVSLVVLPLVLLVGDGLRSWARERNRIEAEPAGDADAISDSDQEIGDDTDDGEDADDLLGELARRTRERDALIESSLRSRSTDRLESWLTVGDRDALVDELVHRRRALAAHIHASAPTDDPHDDANDDRASDRPDAVARAADARDTIAVAVADLKLSILATGGLFAYAAYKAYQEFTAVSAPDPISVGALTAGLLGMLFAGWVTISAWRNAREGTETDPGRPAGDEPVGRPIAETDGGTDREGRR